MVFGAGDEIHCLAAWSFLSRAALMGERRRTSIRCFLRQLPMLSVHSLHCVCNLQILVWKESFRLFDCMQITSSLASLITPVNISPLGLVFQGISIHYQTPFLLACLKHIKRPSRRRIASSAFWEKKDNDAFRAQEEKCMHRWVPILSLHFHLLCRQLSR